MLFEVTGITLVFCFYSPLPLCREAKGTVPCLGRSLGPFGHLHNAAAALQQVRDPWEPGAEDSASSRLSSLLSSTRVRAGTVYSIKMLLEQQCAYVNYTKAEDCDRAILCFNVRAHDW